MGNCGTARDYDDVTGDFQDIEQEYKSANLKSQRKLKQNAESDDPLYSTLISVVPNEYLSTNREHFKRLYRVKKNIKCEDNDFYQIKVIVCKYSPYNILLPILFVVVCLPTYAHQTKL